MKSKVIVICGPTASGKTALSIELAKRIDGQIVSADSMQIYKYMTIGTAKPTEEEMQGIKHYMLDIVEPNKRYSVAEYKEQAKEAIREIIKNGKQPIIVGGTGLYINSLIYEIEYQGFDIDEEYREYLEQIAKKEGLEKLYEQALKIDPQAMEKISKNDKKRIIRVLEIYKQTSLTKTEQEKSSRQKEVEFDYKVFAINMDREILYDRINRRLDIMMKQGLIEEVQNLVKKYKEFPTAMQGLGYKEVYEYIKGNLTKEEMIELLKMETRRYAKRQMTWFRKNKDIIWLDTSLSIEDNIKKMINI